MTELHDLEAALTASLPWHKAHIKFLARFLLALFRVKTVNLTEIADGFGGDAQVASSYKRIQRFLWDFDLDYRVWANLLLAWLNLPGPWLLSLDRTNWQLGQKNLNVLVLSVVCHGLAVPVCWTLLDKKGCSNTDERIAIMKQFLALFPATEIKFLCGDREFIGQRWFHWLAQKGIDYRLRLREDVTMATTRGLVTMKELLRGVAVGEVRVWRGARVVWGAALHIQGTLLPGGEYLIIGTPAECPGACEDYRARWKIECLFGCLKSRGFRLEETHVTKPERLRKVIGLLALGLVWALRVGAWLTQEKPLRLKKHGRAAQSIFRRGLSWLRGVILHLQEPKKQEEFQSALQFVRREEVPKVWESLSEPSVSCRVAAS